MKVQGLANEDIGLILDCENHPESCQHDYIFFPCVA